MHELLKKSLELAKAATPGRYYFHSRGQVLRVTICEDLSDETFAERVCELNNAPCIGESAARHNGEFIAFHNPKTIEAMCEALEKAAYFLDFSQCQYYSATSGTGSQAIHYPTCLKCSVEKQITAILDGALK